MQKAYLMAILLATLVIPFRNASNSRLSKGAQRTALQMALFVLIWGLGCVYVYWSIPN
jgi:hypothetical protein